MTAENRGPSRSDRAEPVTPDSDGRTPGVSGADRVIAVASAKGGVGKSTVSVNLACALASDERVGVFDADIYGPNVPALLGVSGPIRADDEDRPLPVETGGLEVMSVGLMASDGPLAWRGAMAHDALTDLFRDTAWRGPETLVLDLPPGTGDVVLTTLQEVDVDGVVFVTTPFHASVSDTRRSLELFEENDVPVLGVVANMHSFVCPSCGDRHDMFPGDGRPEDGDSPEDALVGGFGAPVLTTLPFEPSWQETPVPGDPPEAAAELADAVRDRFDEVWNPDLPDAAVDLRDLSPEVRREAVADAWTSLDRGEEFVLVSDRDPSPVGSFLADLADVDPAGLPGFAVERKNPETWVGRAEKR